jgi:hypothetical protein
MSKPLCLVTAPVATRSGYGAHSRDICRALIKLDKYDVKIWAVRWGNTPMNALIEGDPNDDIIIRITFYKSVHWCIPPSYCPNFYIIFI